jgi:hypothetical protein
MVVGANLIKPDRRTRVVSGRDMPTLLDHIEMFQLRCAAGADVWHEL